MDLKDGRLIVPAVALPPPATHPTLPMDAQSSNGETKRKRMASDEPSDSSSASTVKKKRAVVEEEEDYDDDCIVLDSSSESSDESVVEVEKEEKVEDKEKETLGNTVKTREKEHLPAEVPIPPANLELAVDYSEVDLIGVTAWDGAKAERRRVERYKRNLPQDVFADFDSKIWTHYAANGQDDDTYISKMSMRMKLLEIAQWVYRGCEVKILAVGSTINGCGSYNSDMDVCLVLSNRDGSIDESKQFAQKNLGRLFNSLRKNNLIKKSNFIRHARVPIIKLETASPNCLEVDINMNNLAGVYNSHLMHYYSRVDDRFAAICLIVKHWAIKQDINDSLKGTFNSYSLILLVLHYLQCGVTPAILPNLQFLYPTRFGERPPLRDLNLFGEFSPPLAQGVMNEQEVGEVLIGFFVYYSKFDFRENAISIRKGKAIPRSELKVLHNKYPIFIEEPFDGQNTARCVKPEYIAEIREAFDHAARIFYMRTPKLKNIDVDV